MMHNMQLKKYLAKYPKKYLIFDFDETITRIEMDWSLYYDRLAKVYEKFDPGHKHLVFSRYDGYNDFVKKYGKKVARLVKVANQKYEQEMARGFTPNPELIKFIKNADRYKKYIYSSNTLPTVLRGVRELELDGCFDQIITRSEVTYIKPDLEGFNLLYDPSVSKSEYLMIGNSFSDQNLAKLAEIDFYLVEYFRPIY
ncbi:HAD family hydrolase [Patescibacteria group bacterium]|nr:HAD family hydrolase [Patescibacteria group bacterium]MBU1966709.1 HAD family hydrolase [Patescibacteria group bacterium]MBU2542966.1 HAD family hydrolase [Patescibacteria group bacterium]